MSMIGFPLLLIPLAIYNIIVFLMPGVSFTDPVLKLTLMSGAGWPLTLSDMLLALAILMLLFEVIKGARPGAKYLTDHLLSLIVFGGAAAEFLLWPRFARGAKSGRYRALPWSRGASKPPPPRHPNRGSLHRLNRRRRPRRQLPNPCRWTTPNQRCRSPTFLSQKSCSQKSCSPKSSGPKSLRPKSLK